MVASVLAGLMLLPGLASADVPGGPRRVAPVCPPGTVLDGPYGHWHCVPALPAAPDPLAEESAPPVPPDAVEPPAPETAPLAPEVSAPEATEPEEPLSPGSESNASSGCGCRVGRDRAYEAAPWALLAAGLWLTVRRRDRRRG